MKPPPVPVRALRIAIVVPGGVDESGERRVIPVLLALIERLARRNEVHVFALQQYDEPRTYRLLGARVTNLGRPRRLARVPGWTMWWRYRALASALAAGGFDVVHAFWATAPGAIATATGRQLGIPSVVSLAGGELVGLPEIGYGDQLPRRTRWLVRRTLERATVLTCASGPIARLLESHGHQAVLVPLGTPAVAEPPAPPTVGPPRLLFVGSLNRVKDPFTLLAAMRRVVDAEPDTQIDVVGADVLAGEVQQRTAELGLGAHVRFHGQRSHADLDRLYRSAQLLVVTSRHEAGPMVALEAAARGVPTVGTHVGHLADAAGVWAATVPVGDAVGLADAVVALTRDPERRSRMARAALAWTRANDADATSARFEELYRGLVRRSPGPT